jgi:hypothetical protein
MNKQLNRKQTIMFVIVNAIAVSISIQVVHGVEIHELNTVEMKKTWEN